MQDFPFLKSSFWREPSKHLTEQLSYFSYVATPYFKSLFMGSS